MKDNETKTTKIYIGVDGKEYTPTEARKLVKRYIQLKAKIKEMEAEISNISSELIAFAGTEKIKIGENFISVSNCTRTAISYTELARKHPKIAKEFANISTYNRINVK